MLLSVKHWPHEASLSTDDESLVRCQLERANAFGVSFGLFAIALVFRKARKAEKAIGDVIGALCRKEVTVVGASHAVDYANPQSRIVFEGWDLIRVNQILQVTGDHAGRPCAVWMSSLVDIHVIGKSRQDAASKVVCAYLKTAIPAT